MSHCIYIAIYVSDILLSNCISHDHRFLCYMYTCCGNAMFSVLCFFNIMDESPTLTALGRTSRAPYTVILDVYDRALVETDTMV